MKFVSLLLLLIATSVLAFTVNPRSTGSIDYPGCNDVTITTASTQIFNQTPSYGNLTYMLVQNKTPTNPVYCQLGSNNTASTTNGTKLAGDVGPGGGSWMPAPPIPALDLACVVASGSGEIQACAW